MTSPLPARAALIGGLLTIIGGLLRPGVALLPLSALNGLVLGQGIGLLVSVVFVGAAVVLAFGVPGEPGIAGRSVAGRVGILLLGLLPLSHALFVVAEVALVAVRPDAVAYRVVGLLDRPVLIVVSLMILATRVVVIVAVARAGAVTGFARWVYIPFTVLQTGATIVDIGVGPFAMIAPGLPALDLVAIAAHLLLGVTLVTWGALALRAPRGSMSPALQSAP